MLFFKIRGGNLQQKHCIFSKEQKMKFERKSLLFFFVSLLILLQFLILFEIASGITIWYDEAWRLFFANEFSFREIVKSSFINGFPTPTSTIYLLLVKSIMNFSGNYLIAEYFLRGISILSALISSFILLKSLDSKRYIVCAEGKLSSLLFLILNGCMTYYFVSIKEHAILTVLILFSFYRLILLFEKNESFGLLDAIIILSANLLSSLAAPMLICFSGILIYSWIFHIRSIKKDLPFFLPIIFICSAIAFFRLLGKHEFEEAGRLFFLQHGLTVGQNTIYGSAEFSFEYFWDFSKSLLGFELSPPILSSISVFAVLTTSLTGAYKRFGRTGVLLILWALASIPIFHLMANNSSPRFFLWIPPILYFFSAHAFIIKNRILKFMLFSFLIIVFFSSCFGIIKLMNTFPQKISIENSLETYHYNPSQDMVLHVDGLTFFHHQVTNPNSKKLIIASIDFGATSMMLHPDYPCLPKVPKRFYSSDSILSSFTGGDIWLCESWKKTEAINEYIRKRAFGGIKSEDLEIISFSAYPVFWTRFSVKLKNEKSAE